MDPVNNNKPHPGAILPADNKAITPDKAFPTTSDDSSESAWAKMFPSGASKEELKQFISLYIQDLMRELRRSDKQHKENMARQKREQEGVYY
jgi:hypothetical protein